MNKLIHRLCPACKRDNRHRENSKYSRDPWRIKQCFDCGFVFLENTPAYEALVSEFAWESTSHAEKMERRRREPVKQFLSDCSKHLRRRLLKRDKLRRLIGRHIPPGNVLEVGCAAGAILSALPAHHVPYGVEISEYLAKKGNRALARRGGHILHADALSGVGRFEADFFTGIIMSAFLEHEADPGGLLRACLRVLEPGGRIIIKVPNYGCVNRWLRGPRWCGFRYPDHVNYFTPASLRRLCEDAGYAVHQFTYVDRHPLSDNMWMVIRKAAPA